VSEAPFEKHPRRIGRAPALIAIALAAALVLAACGGSGKTAAGSSTGPTSAAYTGPAAAGDPIKVMTIAAVNYNGPSYANILTTASLAEKWFNSHGGVAGRPIKVTTCDEQGDPNKLAACGRQAIADKDVAVIGSFTLNGESIIPELAAAKISWFGICCAVVASELSSPIVQQIGSGLSLTGGEVVKAVQDGCKKIALLTADAGATTQFTITLVKNALKSANGPDLAATVLVPLTAQDYSAQVAQATNNTDCIIDGLSETTNPPFLTAFASSGGTQRLYGAQGNLDAKVARPFAQATEGDVVVGSYSDISLPAWTDYRSAISQYKAPKDEDYNSLGGLGTWAAYVVFKQVVESMTGTIDGPTFLAAAQKAKVTFSGLSTGIDFSKPFTGLGATFANAFNRAVTYDIIHNGELVPFQDGKFYDMTNAMIGTPLPAADLPPGGSPYSK
jgi:ABC-type branched-subunit amino acid transport system substrate-binding protein